MSAPRKITTARRIGSGRRDILTAETTMSMGYVDANTYHHDDVVRELIGAAEAVVSRWDTPKWKDAPATGVYINALRASLAKIAQEDKR